MDRVRRRGGRFQRTLPDARKNLVRNRKRFRAGNADDSKPAFNRACGDGGNGVVKVHLRKTMKLRDHRGSGLGGQYQ